MHDVPWGPGSELLVELGLHVDPSSGTAYRVEGIEGYDEASVRIVPAGTASSAPATIRIRPLLPAPGPFDRAGIILLTAYNELPGGREPLLAFEQRIAEGYYDSMAKVRYRYTGACDVTATGIEAPGTGGEAYSIDAATPEEALELDRNAPPPTPEEEAVLAECRTYKTDEPTRFVWLVPAT